MQPAGERAVNTREYRRIPEAVAKVHGTEQSPYVLQIDICAGRYVYSG